MSIPGKTSKYLYVKGSDEMEIHKTDLIVATVTGLLALVFICVFVM